MLKIVLNVGHIAVFVKNILDLRLNFDRLMFLKNLKARII